MYCKNKAIVVIDKEALEQKMMTFIQDNQITRLNRRHRVLPKTDPTSSTKMQYTN